MNDIKIADLTVAAGSAHWATPWDYIEESGSFPTQTVENGRITGTMILGQGLGVHLAIPSIPDMPEGYTLQPGVSRIAVIHRRARVAWKGIKTQALVDFLEAADASEWDGKEAAEIKAHLSYKDAALLVKEIGDGLEQLPFLWFRIHHLIWHASVPKGHARLVNRIGLVFSPGICGYTFLAERPFVEYVDGDDAPRSDDPRVTVVHITENKDQWHDPTGRTTYA